MPLHAFSAAPLNAGVLRLAGGPFHAEALVALQGANVFAWSLDDARGGRLDLLETPASPDTLAADPWGIGTPVLAPWANRVRDARFAWADREIELTPNFPGGHAIHGLVGQRAWTADDLTAAADHAAARLSFHHDGDGEEDGWPFPFQAELGAALDATSLLLQLTVTNLGNTHMPAALGFHPYFALPFLPGTAIEEYTMSLPAAARWVCDEQVLPTGATRPLDGDDDWRGGRPWSEATRLDDCFTAVERRLDGTSVTSLRHEPTRARLDIVGSAAVREWQVYRPGGARRMVAIEPQTCGIDAFNLAARGIDAGMTVLEPGDAMTLTATFRFFHGVGA